MPIIRWEYFTGNFIAVSSTPHRLHHWLGNMLHTFKLPVLAQLLLCSLCTKGI